VSAATKHTPGPWGIVGEKDLPQHDDLMIVAFQVAAPGESPAEDIYICNVGSDGGRFGATSPALAGDRWPVSLANARVLAAAPIMLEVLKTTALNIGSLRAAGRKQLDVWEQVVLEAIAKAEG
jgi:hypothetical protein